jgi:heme-degrading monooxygenase HmoA
MIGRIWHGWTSHSNANAYEELLRAKVLPEIAGMQIPGYQGAHVFRRQLESEVEFITLLWFDSLDSVRAFVGEDYETAHVPPKARALLARYDERSQHYDLLLTPDETG